ncbi:hypothetical protein IWW55_003567 [Coemansia sp. RSA 2706]|nr:hypothetical protein IWW55_003567 [Coemansia sp. RSA 2706]KAJ2737844.1 hypothetical protein H4R23_001562 [Coemansia sp. Cherry 401B]
MGVQEHEYHWWDVFTSRAADYLGPKADDAEQLADQAQRSAVKAGGYITSHAADFGNHVADNAQSLTRHAKDRMGIFGSRAKQQGEKLGEQVAGSAEDLAHDAKERAGLFGHWAKSEGEQLGKQARQAAGHAKQAGMTAHERADAQGRRVMHNAEQTAEDLNRHGVDAFRTFCRRITGQAQGAGSHLRAELKSGLEHLGDMLGSLGASPSWPEAVFEGTKDPMFTKYIQELGQVSKQANAQIQARLDAHTTILERMVRSHLSTQLPLASVYVPVLALLLVYLANSVWFRRNELRRRARQSARVADRNDGSARTIQNDLDFVSDAIANACAYLVLIPMAVVLLVVMELSGMAGWLITSSYTCLVAGTVATAQPAFLVNVWSTDDIASVGQRLAIGIITLAAVCCFYHAVLG